MSKDYKNPEEFDPTKLTDEAVNEAIKEVEDKWHNLGTGVRVKSKLTEQMEGKLSGLVNDAKYHKRQAQYFGCF